MYIYIFIYLLLLLTVILERNKFNSLNYFVYYFILPTFICFGYMTGSDWRNYELAYDDIQNFIAGTQKEKGYYYLGQIFKCIGFSFWEFVILLKLIGYYIVLYNYQKYTNKTFESIIILFVFFMLYLWIDHPARNFCSCIIYITGVKYIYDRKMIPYVLTCFIASLFHMTAIFLIPIYFLYRFYSTKILFVLTVAASTFVIIQSISGSLIAKFLEINDYLALRMSSYMGTEYMERVSLSTSLSTMFHGIIVIFMLSNRKIIESRYSYGYFVLLLSIIFFITSVVGISFGILFRFKYYFILFYCIAISYLYEATYNSIKRFIINILILIVPMGAMIMQITKTSKYIPYSNYLEYSFREKPSYLYRSNYNMVNSPYKTKDKK